MPAKRKKVARRPVAKKSRMTKMKSKPKARKAVAKKIAPAKKVKKKPVIKAKKPSKISKSRSTPPAKKEKKTMQKISIKGPINASSLNLGLMGIPPYQEKKNEEYMSERQQTHFRNILNIWKQQLMEEVDRTVHHMQDEAANYPDPNDRATQEEGFNLELRARDRERKLIKKIEEALQKIEKNEYGFCDICGVEIGIRRLEARPTANLCIDCKTLEEIKERQIGGY